MKIWGLSIAITILSVSLMTACSGKFKPDPSVSPNPSITVASSTTTLPTVAETPTPTATPEPEYVKVEDPKTRDAVTQLITQSLKIFYNKDNTDLNSVYTEKFAKHIAENKDGYYRTQYAPYKITGKIGVVQSGDVYLATLTTDDTSGKRYNIEVEITNVGGKLRISNWGLDPS